MSARLEPAALGIDDFGLVAKRRKTVTEDVVRRGIEGGGAVTIVGEINQKTPHRILREKGDFIDGDVSRG